MSIDIELPDRFVEILLVASRGDLITAGDLQWLCTAYTDTMTELAKAERRLNVIRPVGYAAEDYVRTCTEPCAQHGTPAGAVCACWGTMWTALRDGVIEARSEDFDLFVRPASAAQPAAPELVDIATLEDEDPDDPQPGDPLDAEPGDMDGFEQDEDAGDTPAGDDNQR